jgi:hypothetical protein
VLLLFLCRSWDLLYAACEVLQDINSLLEDQLQQQMRAECAAAGRVLSPDSFTYFVLQRYVPGDGASPWH